MENSRRRVGSMSICGNTSHFEDLKTIENIVSGYKSLGGKVPPHIEIAIEAAKQGQAVEESMNAVCDGLFKFYVAEQHRCAQEAGFSHLDQMYKTRRNDPINSAVDEYDKCVLKVERNWQLTSIDYTINFSNKDSIARQYIEKTRVQILQLINKYIKKRKLKGAARN